MTKTVKDIMHKGLITCLPTTSLGQVASMLNEQHVHALIVAEQADKPLGIITDFDLFRRHYRTAKKDSISYRNSCIRFIKD